MSNGSLVVICQLTLSKGFSISMDLTEWYKGEHQKKIHCYGYFVKVFDLRPSYRKSNFGIPW